MCLYKHTHTHTQREREREREIIVRVWGSDHNVSTAASRGRERLDKRSSERNQTSRKGKVNITACLWKVVLFIKHLERICLLTFYHLSSAPNVESKGEMYAARKKKERKKISVTMNDLIDGYKCHPVPLAPSSLANHPPCLLLLWPGYFHFVSLHILLDEFDILFGGGGWWAPQTKQHKEKK